MAPHSDLLTVALAAADRATAFIMGARRPDPSRWDRKARSDFVTEVDRESERLIAEALVQGAPGSVVVGEELSPTAQPPNRSTAADVVWVVDPLDGTTNFLHDYPAYAVSIAAVVGEHPVAAVVRDLARGVTYHATAGGGAWRGARRLAVSAVSDPALALLGTGFPFKAPANRRLDRYLADFRRILPETSGIRRAGSAALDLAHVAEGRLDGFWEFGLGAWDVAAGILLVREAGGVVTDLAGNPSPITAGDVVAGNGTIQRWLLRALA